MRVKIIGDATNLASLDSLIAEIGKVDPRNLSAHNIVLVKDNFSLTFERDILKKLNRAGTFNVDVYSFSRLLARLVETPPEMGYLTNQGGAMLCARLVAEKRDKLLCYRSLAHLTGFAEEIYELIIQLKTCGVTPQMLAARIPHAQRHLAAKLTDVAALYASYEAFLRHRYFDAADKMDYLCSLIQNSAFIEKANLFLANFDSYTAKDYRALYYLARHASSVTVCCVRGEEDAYPNDAYRKIQEICASLSTQPEVEEHPARLSFPFSHIRNSLFTLNLPERRATGDVFVTRCNDVAQELEQVARVIREGVRERGRRYRDFAVVCQDLDGYRLPLERVFSAFDVPYFLDDGVRLSSHPAAKYLMLLLDIKRRGDGARAHQFIALAKSPFLPFTAREGAQFENYCLKFGVNFTRLYREFTYRHENLDTAEAVRKDVVARLSLLEVPPLATGAEYARVLSDFLVRTDFSGAVTAYAARLEESGEIQLAEYTRQACARIEGVLTEVGGVFEKFYLTLEDFIAVLSSGLNTAKLSLIPLFSDCVFVGSINDCKYLDVEDLFVVGASEALIPVVKRDLGLFTAEDVEALAAGGVDVTPRLESVNKAERFHAAMTLLIPKRRLYVSCPRVGSDGRETVPSRLMGYLSDMFSFEGRRPAPQYRYAAPAQAKRSLARQWSGRQTPRESAEGAACYEALSRHGDTEELDRCFRLARQAPTLLLPNAEGLFFLGGTASATRIETYYACPFRHYVSCGLRAQPREEFGFDPADSGSYLHKVVELYGARAGDIPEERAASDALVDAVAGELLAQEKYSYYGESKAESVRLNRLCAEAKRVCWSLLYQMRHSRYRVLGRELYFGEGGAFPGLPLTSSVRLTGIIDRLDVWEDSCRVVDYKTGKISNSLTDVYTGKKLQLYLYQQVAIRAGYRPGGAFYYPVHYEFAAEETPDYRLVGAASSDPEVLLAMDTELAKKGESPVLALKAEGSGGFKPLKSRLHLLPAETLASLSDYAQLVAARAVERIKEGDIRALPESGACAYCEYRTVCMSGGENVREKNFSATEQTISEAVEQWKNGLSSS